LVIYLLSANKMNYIIKFSAVLIFFLNISCGLKIIMQFTSDTKIAERVNAHKYIKRFFKKLVLTTWIFKGFFTSSRSIH
jgi:hypothetical protein